MVTLHTTRLDRQLDGRPTSFCFCCSTELASSLGIRGFWRLQSNSAGMLGSPGISMGIGEARAFAES